MSHDAQVEEVGHIFRRAGWEITAHPRGALFTPDLLLSKSDISYVAEVKVSPEGRPDRLIALLAQAILQAEAYVADFPKARPLAIIWTRSVTASLIEKVEIFQASFARQAAIGIVTAQGDRHFVGDELGSLNNAQHIESENRTVSVKVRGASNLFSDLNQWMMKVLLAPQIPVGLLVAPRASYRTVTQLAAAADVSPMTASRFVTALREEGFLDAGRTLRLVRRGELSRRWKANYASSTPEAAVRFLLPGSLESRLGRLFGEHEACIGLFDAAARLNVGYVEGVPPYLYVRNLEHALRWKQLVPDERSSQPALILKQAPAPESLFRGREQRNGMFVSDVLQIWLDSASHPSRGHEQSHYLESTVLKGVIGEFA
jgi:hypothetical protein